MGLTHPIYSAFNFSPHIRYSIAGDEIAAFRKRVESRRIAMLKQGKWCGDGRRGHGRATRIRPIEKLTNKVEQFKETINHKYSRYIVNLAIKHDCGVIQMEDLSGIADGDKKASFSGYWTYYDLQQKIAYKAKEAGIEMTSETVWTNLDILNQILGKRS